MKIKFLGAAREVTGSCFIIETDKARFAVDCGMHQGSDEIEKRNWDVDIYEPERIDFILITHAHIDHSGLLPRIVQKGFRGPIYATEPTGDLIKILLLDSAHIQEVESTWKIKKMQRYGKANDALPLYTTKDAESVGPLIKTKTYNEIFSPAKRDKSQLSGCRPYFGRGHTGIIYRGKRQIHKINFLRRYRPSPSTIDERPRNNQRGGFSFYGINLWRPQSQR